MAMAVAVTKRKMTKRMATMMIASGFCVHFLFDYAF